LAATVHRLAAGGDPERPEEAAQAARVAADRMDDAFRQYLAERSSKQMTMDGVATLVAGATRVRRTALSLLTITPMTDVTALADGCGELLERDLDPLQRWYARLGQAIADGAGAPPQDDPDIGGRRRVLECAQRAVAEGHEASIAAALNLLWASQQLHDLWRLEAHLAKPASGSVHPPVAPHAQRDEDRQQRDDPGGRAG
jgi:hypothetical protein